MKTTNCCVDNRIVKQIDPNVVSGISIYRSYLHRNWPSVTSVAAQSRRRVNSRRYPIPFFFPKWSLGAFPKLSGEATRSITIGNIFLYHYYTLKDDIVDGEMSRSQDSLIGDVLFAEALRYFTQHGSSANLHRYVAATLRNALSAEFQLHASGWPDQHNALGRKNLRLLAAKSSPAKLYLFAAAEACGTTRHLADFDAALDDAAIALQLLDDLKDWKDDAEENRPSLVLSLPKEVPLRDYTKVKLALNDYDRVLRVIEEYALSASTRLQRVGASEFSEFMLRFRTSIVEIRTKIADGSMTDLDCESAVSRLQAHT